jgi:hypothetical protein
MHYRHVVGCLVSIGLTFGQQLIVNQPNSYPYVVQKNKGSTSSSVKTLSVAFTSNTNVNNLLIYSCGGSDFHGNYVATDSLGNVWGGGSGQTAAGANNNYDVVGSQGTVGWTAIFSAVNISSGADTVTLTISGGSSANQSIACELYEVFGVSLPSWVDATSTGSSVASTAVATGATFPASGNGFSVAAVSGTNGSLTITPAANWVFDSGTVQPASGGLTFGSESQFFTGRVGTVTGSATLNSSNAWAAAVVNYKTYLPSVQAVFPKLTPYFVNAISAKTQVVGVAARLYGLHLDNPNTSKVYVQFFDALSANVTLGSTTPTFVIVLPASSTLDDPTLTIPINFSTGLTFAVTTTATGSTAPSTGITGTIFYM